MLILPYTTEVDTNGPSAARTPWMNWVVAGLCVAFFLILLVATIGFDGFNYLFGVWAIAFTSLSWLFHFTFQHLFGNLLFLWAFGNLANRRMGPWWYLGFVIAAGVGSAFSHNLFSEGTAVGASGVVFACVGYGLVREPTTRLYCTYWILIKWGTIRLPLWSVVGVLLLGQAILFGLEEGTLVSYPAHAFGLLWGMLCAGIGCAWGKWMGKRRGRKGEPVLVAGE